MHCAPAAGALADSVRTQKFYFHAVFVLSGIGLQCVRLAQM